MIFKPTKKAFFIGLVMLLTATCDASDWRFDLGVGIRNLSPMVLVGGFGYKDITFRMQGLGAHSGPNDFWCGIRGSLLWTFFKDLPFNFDAGIGSGYDFAKAPNKMHQALNDANNANYLYGYNYRENLDVSLELWTHLYGFYTQISIPAYPFIKHDAPKVLWGAGYLFQF